ncbi:sugar phosphorylase [Metabacillus sp. GX 13764]|uniref:sugar phosphorylase n=1 Tax=Metabacillus kandeliae TaxID=2900151 RepID=UPI001E54F722|nr:sugar phosphorylase [Metabacillus kandeliae]MCD7035687.1 sugar phosphorylase [Metabacillus kandeliae]
MTKEKLLQDLKGKLQVIYGEDYEEDCHQAFEALVDKWAEKDWRPANRITEKNTYLIAYGDSIYEDGKPALSVLHRFLKEQAGGAITDVHLLPMFPYTSDDGFSVTDYRQIDPALGGWQEIEAFSKDYRLMFDFVANHISKSSSWFQQYLNDEGEYQNFFIPKENDFDDSQVVRPRTSLLFHEYEGKNGKKTAWTTFSEDQVDVNVKHWPVLIELTDILLTYAHKGGTSIRLDAIGFLWKESGTSCIHLPRTHEIIKLWRSMLDYFRPNAQLITETNVPHKENISYLGSGTDEANMVYQFSLPPLVLYALSKHDGSKLSQWASGIQKISENATFFNFLASHDGIGMRPTEGILTEEERQLLVEKTESNGGRVSYKANPDGSKTVYELNINYSEALVNKEEDVSLELQIQKTLAAHSILLSVVGVPAIYYHSLLGSKNDLEGLAETGINRRINREKLAYSLITEELEENSRRKNIFGSLKEMIALRQTQPAFSPYGEQEVLQLGKSVFALKRGGSEKPVYFAVNLDVNETQVDFGIEGYDLIQKKSISGPVTLGPYQFIWAVEE